MATSEHAATVAVKAIGGERGDCLRLSDLEPSRRRALHVHVRARHFMSADDGSRWRESPMR